MKRQTIKQHFIIACLLVLAVLLIGCSSQNTEQETIKVGLVAPLTGEIASWGQNALAGVTLAINEVNANGGINGKRIELIVEDDVCSSESVTAVHKLIDVDKVVGILGPLCSSAAGPALPIAQDKNVPTVIITASAPHLTKIGDAIFRVYPSDSFQGKFAADFIYNALGKRTVALVYVENDWGFGIKEVFKKRFEELGGNVVYQGSVLQTQTDLRAELTKIKAHTVEALYAPIYPANAVAGFKQLSELGMNITVIGGDVLDSEEVIKSGYGEGVIFTVPHINTPEEFTTQVKSLLGFSALQVNLAAPLAYDAAKVLFAAFETAGTNPDAVQKALAQTSYKGVSSPLITFDGDGDLQHAVFDAKIIKGKQAMLYDSVS